MIHKQLLAITGFLFVFGGAAHASLFLQSATSTSDWGEGQGTGTFGATGNDGVVSNVDISNPPAGVIVSTDRGYAYSDAGIGTLQSAAAPITWSFEFSVSGTSAPGGADTYSVIIAGTDGRFDAGGTAPADVYSFGTDLGGTNLVFGYTDQGGKNGVETTLYDTGVAAWNNASGSVSITYNPTGDVWTVSGDFNGSNFTATDSTFSDATYTGVDTSFVGPYVRDSSASLTLSNMEIAAIPEPASIWFLLSGAVGLLAWRPRRRNS